MAPGPVTACPTPGKARYLAEFVEHAAQHHREQFPTCPGVHPYLCASGLHHHIGHETAAAGRACRRTPSADLLGKLADRFARR